MADSKNFPLRVEQGVKELAQYFLYRFVFISGFLASVWVVAVFLFGPQSWNEGKIPHTFGAVVALLLVIVIPAGYSLGAYFLCGYLEKRWPGVGFL